MQMQLFLGLLKGHLAVFLPKIVNLNPDLLSEFSAVLQHAASNLHTMFFILF